MSAVAKWGKVWAGAIAGHEPDRDAGCANACGGKGGEQATQIAQRSAPVTAAGVAAKDRGAAAGRVNA
jgi:hypothetical protein